MFENHDLYICTYFYFVFILNLLVEKFRYAHTARQTRSEQKSNSVFTTGIWIASQFASFGFV